MLNFPSSRNHCRQNFNPKAYEEDVMKKAVAKTLTVLFLTGILMTGFSASWAKDISPAEFYKKNTLTMYIGFSPGGGTDYVSRLFASYWPKVTDGGKIAAKNKTFVQ